MVKPTHVYEILFTFVFFTIMLSSHKSNILEHCKTKQNA